MTVPLSEVFFPSVVVCNINQVRKSFFEELGIYDNETFIRQIYYDYIEGKSSNTLHDPHSSNVSHSLIRGVLIQSCSVGVKNFTNYVFCHPQFSGVIQNIENHCAIKEFFLKINFYSIKLIILIIIDIDKQGSKWHNYFQYFG